jgi:hypothetical protein
VQSIPQPARLLTILSCHSVEAAALMRITRAACVLARSLLPRQLQDTWLLMACGVCVYMHMYIAHTQVTV